MWVSWVPLRRLELAATPWQSPQTRVSVTVAGPVVPAASPWQ